MECVIIMKQWNHVQATVELVVVTAAMECVIIMKQWNPAPLTVAAELLAHHVIIVSAQMAVNMILMVVGPPECVIPHQQATAAMECVIQEKILIPAHLIVAQHIIAAMECVIQEKICIPVQLTAALLRQKEAFAAMEYVIIVKQWNHAQVTAVVRLQVLFCKPLLDFSEDYSEDKKSNLHQVSAGLCQRRLLYPA